VFSWLSTAAGTSEAGVIDAQWKWLFAVDHQPLVSVAQPAYQQIALRARYPFASHGAFALLSGPVTRSSHAATFYPVADGGWRRCGPRYRHRRPDHRQRRRTRRPCRDRELAAPPRMSRPDLQRADARSVVGLQARCRATVPANSASERFLAPDMHRPGAAIRASAAPRFRRRAGRRCRRRAPPLRRGSSPAAGAWSGRPRRPSARSPDRTR